MSRGAVVITAEPDEPLARAADRLAAALADDPGRAVEVRLAPGTYRLSARLRLGGEHSGTARHPVTWIGAGAMLSGGVPLVWQAGGDGRWVATVPDGVVPADLFVGGRRSPRARTAPQPADVCHAVPHGLTGARAVGLDRWARPEAVTCVATVRWRAYHLPVSGVVGDVVTFPEPCWTNARGGTGRVGPHWDTTALDGSQFAGGVVFENAIELLAEPGDHVWDPVARTITYQPLPDQDPARCEGVIPVCENLLVLDGAQHVRFAGLTFRHSAFTQVTTPGGYVGAQAGLTLTGADGPREAAGRFYTKPPAALVVRRGSDVTVEGCDFRGLAGAGVVLEHGSRDCDVTGSTFEDLGSGAVYLGDTDPHPPVEQRSWRNTVSRCVVRRCGARYTDAVAIWAGYVSATTIDHNTVEDVPYSGISIGWGWNQPEARASVLHDNRVTANRVVDVMRPASGMHDGGAIYVQGAQPGTVIACNYLDRSGYGGTQRDGNGIYLDEESSFVLVERNVVTRVGYKWVSNWAAYGIANRLDGNWTDTDAPPLGGAGSGTVGDHVRLPVLPPEAIAVAAAAGAERVAPVWGGDIDLARGRPATQSTVAATAARTTEDLSRLGDGQVDAIVAAQLPPVAAAIAVDGNTCTDTATRDEPDSWWRVDLGAERSIGVVELWNAESMISRDVVVEVTDAAGRTTASITVAGPVRRPSLVAVAARGRHLIVRRAGGGIALATVVVHPACE